MPNLGLALFLRRLFGMSVPFYQHQLNEEHAARIADVLKTPFLTSGPISKQVEKQLCDFFSCEAAILTSSWTTGATALLMALEIGEGDEVIVPAMTFIATANIAELVGAKPIFVDVDPGTLMMTPEAVLAALTPRTKAVIPVHLYGQMVDVKALREALSHRPEIAIIEDCAHCFEGSLNGDRPGKYSDAAVFSFYATKNVTCGEGGAIVSRHQDLIAKIQKTRLHGMSAGAADRFQKGSYRHWDMEVLGTKANLPDLLATLLVPQIETICDRLPMRARIVERYRAAFANLPIRMQTQIEGCVSAEHIFPIHVDPRDRDNMIVALNEQGINVTVNYRSVPDLTFYRNKYGFTPSDFPVSHEWGAGTLTLPLFPTMTDEQVDQVIHAVVNTIPQLVKAS